MPVLSAELLDFSLLNYDVELWKEDAELPVIDWPESVEVIYANWKLENGVVGIDYDASFAIPTYTAPTIFDISSGSLPDGLSIDTPEENTCRIYGTPTTAGYFVFTIRATAPDGIGQRVCAIHILSETGGSGAGICVVF
jgi:hypothetical protein